MAIKALANERISTLILSQYKQTNSGCHNFTEIPTMFLKKQTNQQTNTYACANNQTAAHQQAKHNLSTIDNHTWVVVVSLTLIVDTCLTIWSTSRRPGRQFTQLFNDVDAALATCNIMHYWHHKH